MIKRNLKAAIAAILWGVATALMADVVNEFFGIFVFISGIILFATALVRGELD